MVLRCGWEGDDGIAGKFSYMVNSEFIYEKLFMKPSKIMVDENKLADIAQKFQIKELCLFGSVLRDDFNSTSDVDILITFKENVMYSFFEFYDLKEKLEILFNRKIDLIEKKGLKNPYRRQEILATARRIYVSA